MRSAHGPLPADALVRQRHGDWPALEERRGDGAPALLKRPGPRYPLWTTLGAWLFGRACGQRQVLNRVEVQRRLTLVPTNPGSRIGGSRKPSDLQDQAGDSQVRRGWESGPDWLHIAEARRDGPSNVSHWLISTRYVSGVQWVRENSDTSARGAEKVGVTVIRRWLTAVLCPMALSTAAAPAGRCRDRPKGDALPRGGE